MAASQSLTVNGCQSIADSHWLSVNHRSPGESSMKALLALAALALSLSAFSTRAEACGGFTPARCHCKAVGYQHMADKAVQVNIAGQDFFTFTVPNKCFNQVVDWGQYHFNKGCWLACRDAFGVEGHAQDPGVIAAKQAAAAMLATTKGLCGGYVQAELHFAAGTNKFRNATGSPVAFGAHPFVTVAGKKVCK